MDWSAVSGLDWQGIRPRTRRVRGSTRLAQPPQTETGSARRTNQQLPLSQPNRVFFSDKRHVGGAIGASVGHGDQKNDQGTRHKFAGAHGSSPSPLFRWKSLELRAPLRSRERETGGSFLWRRWGDTHSFAALCPQGVPPPSSCHSGYSRHSPQELILRQNWRSCADRTQDPLIMGQKVNH